jgi:hypothetical protein
MNPTSKIVALSSALAFALQIVLALLMLRYFSPEEVGTFSVISQIGFFWTTLALAQAPLQLLANHDVSVLEDARLAWVASIKRFIWLLPIAALAVWWSRVSFINTLLWALLLSFCQLTWMLAQSMRLRMSSAWSQVGVRVLPPLIALLATSVGIHLEWSGFVLLSAALLGYAVGAAWLFPAFLIFPHSNSDDVSVACHTEASTVSGISSATENPSTSLRMAHTLVDALLATAIVVVWQRLYDAQETGWMTAPLRVMGFVPAVVHMAWAQVVLAQPQHTRTNPLWVGLGGAASVALLGIGCAVALEIGWLSEEWQGVKPYLFPLVLWQGSACLAAAFSHLPFQSLIAQKYSWVCIGVASLQGSILLLPALHIYTSTSQVHLLIFSVISAFSLLTMTLYLHSVDKENTAART